MKKIFVVLILLLSACDSNHNSDSDSIIYKAIYKSSYSKDCIDGKEFLVGFRSLSINLDFDGKPIRCEVQDDKD